MSINPAVSLPDPKLCCIRARNDAFELLISLQAMTGEVLLMPQQAAADSVVAEFASCWCCKNCRASRLQAITN
jgi:hypothetical protein